MISIGTPLKPSATKVMLLGSGELGKEVVIAFQRYGVEVIAVDRYDDAPAMQVAHRSYTISMLDGKALREVIEKEDPDYIDFAYFSFVIGMTFQVSDVQVNSRVIRRFVLMHSLISFVFNTIIVALTINTIAGLKQ